MVLKQGTAEGSSPIPSSPRKILNRKRSMPPTPATPAQIKKRSSQVTHPTLKSPGLAKLAPITDTKNKDLWAKLILSLKGHVKAELKMFEEEGTEPEIIEADDECSCLAYSNFLCQLVEKFTKLRRFPKLIAKLLCCQREIFIGSSDMPSIPGVDLLLPREFLDSTSSIIAALPAGQIIDLWKTLFHNLKQQCIDVLETVQGSAAAGAQMFTLVVSELFCHFLMNVKVVDHSVQASTLDKVNELMNSLSSECLAKFGSYFLAKTNDLDLELLAAFLKLTYAWAELQGLQLHYNKQRYKAVPPSIPTDSSPVNLSYLHTFMTPESWLQLESLVESCGDPSCSAFIVKLVAQKLKFMLTLEKRIVGDQEDVLLQENLNAAAKYIWSKQEMCGATKEMYALASDFLDPTETIDLASNFITELQNEKIGSGEQEFPLDFQLHYALVLETISQIMNRLAKIKQYKKILTNVSNEILSSENRSHLFLPDTESKNFFQLLLNSVNELIDSESGAGDGEEICEDFSCDLIADHIRRLNELNLEDYPLDVRAVISMCSIIIFIPLVRVATNANESLRDMMSSVLFQCAHNCKGNEYLFSVQWTKLFHWFLKNMSILSGQCQRDLVLTFLQNIYVSSKSIDDFKIEFDTLCKRFQFSKPNTNVGLITLQFLLNELKTAIQTKSKLVPKIQSHIAKLTDCVTQFLESVSQESSNPCSQSNLFRACWLLRRTTATTEASEDDKKKCQLDVETQKRVFGKQLRAALNILLPASNVGKLGLDEEDSNYSRMYALLLLHSLCKSRTEFEEVLPEKFITKLWKINMSLSADDWKDLSDLVPDEKIRLFPQTICENATSDEFETVLASLSEEFNQAGNDKFDAKMGTISTILDVLIDSKLEPEKKTLRTKFMEKFLYASLQFNLQWNASEDCLDKVVLPSLRFQTKLLSRKNPICCLTALATCLTSVTSTPLTGIADSSVYRKVYCAVADLMNALTLHRVDVISFRTHIYLQCFQYLAENLISRSDQKNKLTDLEVLDLRYCAHALERICQSTKPGRKEFARIGPYFVAILMRQFEMFTVYPTVKDPLLSGTYKLLNLCDSHGISQMNSMLTLGSREIFTRIYDLYNRFYRYKGKV